MQPLNSQDSGHDSNTSSLGSDATLPYDSDAEKTEKLLTKVAGMPGLQRQPATREQDYFDPRLKRRFVASREEEIPKEQTELRRKISAAFKRGHPNESQ